MINRTGQIGKKQSEQKIDLNEAERLLESLSIGERFRVRKVQK